MKYSQPENEIQSEKKAWVSPLLSEADLSDTQSGHIQSTIPHENATYFS